MQNEQRLLSALTDAERRRLADLLRKLQLGLPPSGETPGSGASAA
jgi:hypothetical protein